MPPEIIPDGAKPIRIEDVDGAVLAWFRHNAPKAGTRDVHVTFSSPERWVIAADKAGVRDKNGRLILPIIEVVRTNVRSTEGELALGVNVPTLQVAKQVSPKTSDLLGANSRRAISERYLSRPIVYDIYSIPFPSITTLSYSVRIQTQYNEHLSEIIEKVMNGFEFFDVPCFLLPLDRDNRTVGIRAGQGPSEVSPGDHQPYGDRPRIDYPYVVAYVESEFSTPTPSDMTDQERIIQTEFSFRVPCALQLDPKGERPAVQKQRSAFSLSLDVEECHSVDSFEELDDIFGPK